MGEGYKSIFGLVASFSSFSFLASSMFAIAACGGNTTDETETEPDPEATADQLQSSPLADSDMKKIPKPAGMPEPWDQPDSTGWLEEKGKCGPTAVANTLRLYGINNVSPKQADQDGVNWIIGSRGINIEHYFQEKHARLGCKLEHPENGPAFLRAKVAEGRPVMVWYNTAGSLLSSHWVTVVGTRGTGASELAVVMSWGDYYTIPMAKLDAAWRNVYWIRRPSVVCNAKSSFLTPPERQ
jgi:hypothetical protein